MRTLHIALLLTFGVLFWVVGTFYYAHAGPAVLEISNRLYWINFIAVPTASAVISMAILIWLHIPTAQWASGALLIALPGLFGEALVLTNFRSFMPKLQAASGGRYAAFLFVAYAVVLSIAEVVTLKFTVERQQFRP